MVVDGAGVGGGKALTFRDGPGGAIYFPHIYRKVEYTTGKVLIAFDVMAEEGAHMRFDARDWDQEKYFNGPPLELKPDGTVAASGKALVKAPHDEWIRIQAVCPVGPDSDGTYDVKVTLPGAKQPARFSGLESQDGFETITWVGFSCNVKKRVAYTVDNLTIKQLGGDGTR